MHIYSSIRLEYLVTEMLFTTNSDLVLFHGSGDSGKGLKEHGTHSEYDVIINK